MTCKLNAPRNKVAYGVDYRDLPSSLSLGVLVHQAAGGRDYLSRFEPARRWCGLAADRPDPRFGVDISHEASADFTDARCGTGLEDDDVAPSLIATKRSCDESVCECRQRIPVR